MQENILEPNPDADLIVYAIWFNMLGTDHHSRWDDKLLPDDRVIHLWDEEKLIGCWYAQQGLYPFGRTAWDIYFLYSPEAQWEEVPEPQLSSGFTIIVQSQQLLEDITPLIESP